MEKYQRTYCEIDLDAIRTNVINIKKKAGDVKVAAVVKADGYGHGAVPIANYVKDLIDYFAVATVEEGVELREGGIELPIMTLGYVSPKQYDLNLKYDIEQTIYSLETAEEMSRQAVEAGKTAKIHIALDTGMTRIGISPDEKGLQLVKKIAALPGIKIQGLFTHLSCADMSDQTYTYGQMDRYDHFVELLDGAGIEIPVKHLCNSAGIMEFDHHRYNMVRAGIILYGLYPSDEVHYENLPMCPALSWKAHVVNIMHPEMNRGISYGATYVTDHPCTIATVSIGYADGYPRSLSNKGWVLIHGKKAPIVGRVCMDQTMVDITDIPDVKIEDTVTLIGSDGDARISVEDMADLAGSFNYEFICDISKRVPRDYIGKNLK
ncbi:MAG: alanine racemase [Lachnospiraceae bacterium]|nr:alanine racemase [Lachnospiraceae bacterium]